MDKKEIRHHRIETLYRKSREYVKNKTDPMTWNELFLEAIKMGVSKSTAHSYMTEIRKRLDKN